MKSSFARLAHAFHFAAIAHTNQRRKGARGEPYVNHVAEVAHLLADATAGTDTDLVIAGILHDVVEDTETTAAELAAIFGDDVATLVAEVSDDKALPKAERKRLQIETAPKKSDRAKMLKIADKTSNLRSIAESPPAGWPLDRQQAYFDWAGTVVDHCRGINEALDAAFDAAFAGRPTDGERD